MRTDCVTFYEVNYAAHMTLVFSSFSVAHNRCSVKANGQLTGLMSPPISTLIPLCLSSGNA